VLRRWAIARPCHPVAAALVVTTAIVLGAAVGAAVVGATVVDTAVLGGVVVLVTTVDGVDTTVSGVGLSSPLRRMTNTMARVTTRAAARRTRNMRTVILRRFGAEVGAAPPVSTIVVDAVRAGSSATS